MAQDTASTVELKYDFYHDRRPKLLLALLLIVAVDFVVGLVIVYINTHPPKPVFFPTSINQRITQLVPLDVPNQKTSAIYQWAAQAVIASYTYNFVSYQDQLKAASGYFTAEGWAQFLEVLKKPENLPFVKARKAVVSAEPTRAPNILVDGIMNGTYTWRVQIPIRVTYHLINQTIQRDVVVTMLIKRVSSVRTPRGIAISQFIVDETGEGQVGSEEENF